MPGLALNGSCCCEGYTICSACLDPATSTVRITLPSAPTNFGHCDATQCGAVPLVVDLPGVSTLPSNIVSVCTWQSAWLPTGGFGPCNAVQVTAELRLTIATQVWEWRVAYNMNAVNTQYAYSAGTTAPCSGTYVLGKNLQSDNCTFPTTLTLEVL